MPPDDQQRFNPDAPLTADAPDLLGRREFCSCIADQICIPHGKPGLTFSIEGPWGFGKTSALNLIAQHLEKSSQPIIVHFNPWMIGSVEALAQEFFVQMASAIGLSPHAETAKKLTASLTSYSSLFSVAKVIPGFEPWASLIAKGLELSSEGTKALTDLTELNIAKQKKRVSEGILELGKPIVVFIDDMDRLMPKEVFAVIRLIKAISDFPQVTYVLAFDPPYIEAALKKSGVSNGRSYLDKIVQVRIPLPPIGRKQIAQIVNTEISKLDLEEAFQYFPEEREHIQHLYQSFLKFLLRTPRDVYRVFNRLHLLYLSVKKEIGISDLLALETIAITAPAPLRSHPRKSRGLCRPTRTRNFPEAKRSC